VGETKETALFEESDIIVLMVVVMLQYNFAVVLYWREAWSLRLREERRLRVFQNRVLKKIFGL
jgi:hypothetical protein